MSYIIYIPVKSSLERENLGSKLHIQVPGKSGMEGHPKCVELTPLFATKSHRFYPRFGGQNCHSSAENSIWVAPKLHLEDVTLELDLHGHDGDGEIFVGQKDTWMIWMGIESATKRLAGFEFKVDLMCFQPEGGNLTHLSTFTGLI